MVSYELSETELIRLRAGVRIMALQRLGDPELAEEIAQESMARVVQAVREGKLREPERLGGFARAIAQHVIVDTMRARKRSVDLGAAAPIAASTEHPLERICTEEQITELRRALRELTAGDHELLRLAFFGGLTSQELADRLSEPGPRVRKRKERALKRLRQALSNPGGHDSAAAPTLGKEAVLETDA